ncbi:MAG TPA: hypothetical protein PKD54_14125 [Pirellulaceae bacterium]|nr:hypothetical protein [Pirellulaceae bacterium]
MIENQRQRGSTLYEAMVATMRRLETLAEHDEDSACALMVHLWSHASQLVGAHDVCDGIDLWIADNKSSLVRKQLEELLGMDNVARVHFQQILEQVSDG